MSKKDKNVKCFNAQMSDGKKCLHVISFEPLLSQATYEQFIDQQRCCVPCRLPSETSAWYGGLEITLNKLGNKVQRSPKKFDDDSLTTARESTVAVELSDL